MTQCSGKLELGAIGKRTISVDFNGGAIASDGGILLLREVERRVGLIHRLSGCLEDRRDPNRIRHTVEDLLRQRVFQICCGYEDANDADRLRSDPALKTACDRELDPDDDLGSQPTLTRLENAADNDTIQRLLQSLVDHWLEHRQRPADGRIILDVDSTDDETHGQQEFAEFHGYYRHYCYQPVLIHDGETGDLILPFLRPGRVSARLGADGLLIYLADRVREKWPGVQVIVRGDSGYCGEDFYLELETHGIDYVLGIAKNANLNKLTETAMKAARLFSAMTERKTTIYAEGRYQAGSWTTSRRVIAKAERLKDKDNQRFVVTTLDEPPAWIYREFYVKRGEASENRIKDLKLDCSGDRLSCHRFITNFFRLILHTAAYTLMHELRKACKNTRFGRARIETLRLRLVKIGVRIRQTTRRIWFHLSESTPEKELWTEIMRKLVAA